MPKYSGFIWARNIKTACLILKWYVQCWVGPSAVERQNNEMENSGGTHGRGLELNDL